MHRTRRPLRFPRTIATLAILALTSLATGSAVASYHIVTPDSDGDVGIAAALALHTAPQVPPGGAVAAYLLHRPDGWYDLRWAERWAGTWHSYGVPSTPDAVAPAIATDGSGVIHIVYSSGGALKHAFRTHALPWTFEDIPFSGYVTGLSATADAAGRLHVSFEGVSGLFYALRSSSGVWSWEQAVAYQVAEMGGLYYHVTTSIAVDAAGDPHIAYFYGETDLLRYPGFAHKTQAGWSLSWPVGYQDLFDTSWVTSLTLDSQGHPHAAYAGGWMRAVFHNGGSGWAMEAGLPSGGQQVSLAVDSSDRPCVLVARDGQIVFAVFKGASWEEEVVAASCNSEWFSLCLAYDGPRVAFYDACTADLKIASGGSSYDYVEVPDGPGAVGFGTSIGLTRLVPVSGQSPQSPQATSYEEARISYSSYGGRGVFFAARQGSGLWNIETVDPTGYGFTSLAALAEAHSDEWAVAYCGDAGGDQAALRYAVRSNGTWSVEDVTTQSAWTDTWDTWPTVSLAVGPGEQPHIVFSLGYCESSLLYATRDASQWSVEEITDACAPASVVVDGAGTPHVAFHDGASLVYARRGAGGWTTEFVGSAMYLPETAAPSIALDSQGRPSISYYRLQHLYVATRGDAGWTTELVDPESGVGAHSTLRFDGMDRKHVAYSRANGALKYAEQGVGGWTIETLLGDGGVGRYPSLALSESGKPRIACYVADGQDLLYFARPLEPEPVTAVDESVLPARFSASAPWPNPLRAGTHLQLAVELPTADRVGIALYDVAGRRVAACAEESYPAGRHLVRWLVAGLDPGVYFLHVRAARGGAQSVRLVAMR